MEPAERKKNTRPAIPNKDICYRKTAHNSITYADDLQFRVGIFAPRILHRLSEQEWYFEFELT